LSRWDLDFPPRPTPDIDFSTGWELLSLLSMVGFAHLPRSLAACAILLWAGCFSPKHPECQVLCGTGGSCPPDLSCAADGYCHASGDTKVCAAEDWDAAPVDSAVPPIDGAREVVDAGPIDAAPDAFYADAGMPMNPGDLIVTEIMHSPNGGDTTREWFEVYNTTAVDLDMNGMTVRDDVLDIFSVNGSLVVPAGGYAVLGRSSDMGANDGVPVDYAYGLAMALASQDSIVLEQGAVEIDRVNYSEFGDWPDGTNAAASLDPGALSSTLNDSGANWCRAVTPYGSDTPMNKGTPGAANPACP
jgi:hypothetical protein